MKNNKMFNLVKEAQQRLQGAAHVTPVMTSQTLNQLTGSKVFLKCENFQRMGAFKFRGAYNAMSQLTDEQKKRGVITHSSGNHAQAVALVGRLLGIRTTVVMPNDAPAVKRTATEEYGATVIDYDTAETTREEISRDLVKERGYTLVPPYDHINIVAGQGTAALELLEKVQEFVADTQTVAESAIIEAVGFLFYRMKLVVEPSGALGVAALLSGAVSSKERIGVILSGGNIDAATMKQVLDC
jgi:threonine dehydratase